MGLRATVVIDYQNVHLTGHGLFCTPGEARHLCLVHPLHYAHQVLSQRNLMKRLVAEKDGRPFAPVELAEVVSFRGQPSNHQDPNGYRRSMAQRSEWTRDPRSKVRYRTLKYYEDGSIKEKGIDVMIALKLVEAAAQNDAEAGDVVILAAHDTDQEPSLEMAHRLTGRGVETVGWDRGKHLRVPGARIWHTTLDGDHFIRSRDRRDYT